MTQRSLTALHIGNFKAFADTQRIPLKPITLIFGPNSAGKSSFLQSLAFAHQAALGRSLRGGSPLDVFTTEIGGKSIDLGGFRQFVHQRQADRRVTWGAELAVASLDQRLRELLGDAKQLAVTVSIGIELDDQGRALPGAEPRVDSFEFEADGEELLYASARNDASVTDVLRIDRLAVKHPLWQNVLRALIDASTTTTARSEADMSAAQRAVADLLPKLDMRCSRLFPESVTVRKTAGGPVQRALGLIPVGRGTRPEDLATAIDAWLPQVLDDLIRGIAGTLDTRLAEIHYLGPVRERPARHLAAPEQRDVNWTAGGGFAWDILARDERVRERVNQWLGGHPGINGAEAALAAMERDDGTGPGWMKTPYQLFVERYTANTGLRDVLKSAFLEQPLTLLKRRELLTKDLAQVYAELQEQYETDQARVEEYAQQLAPWIERIQAARSTEEAERIRQEAMATFEAEQAKGPSREEQDELSWEQQIEQLLDEDANGRAEDFMVALNKRGVSTIDELRLQDVNKKNTVVALCDVGFGVSQVLPVLTLAYASHDALVTIEQPEIHLHPGLQAELADVFIESALGEQKNTFLLETHSEHLILRVMRRMRETWQKKQTGLPKISPSDVAVLYVEPVGSRSIVREMPLNEAGGLVKAWPGGFFEEGLREQFADA